MKTSIDYGFMLVFLACLFACCIACDCKDEQDGVDFAQEQYDTFKDTYGESNPWTLVRKKRLDAARKALEKCREDCKCDPEPKGCDGKLYPKYTSNSQLFSTMLIHLKIMYHNLKRFLLLLY